MPEESIQKEITAEELAHELLIKISAFNNDCARDFLPDHIYKALMSGKKYRQDRAHSYMHQHGYEIKHMKFPHPNDKEMICYAVIWARNKVILRSVRFECVAKGKQPTFE